ncbi:hypothetical protein [Pseudoalteromonas piratica]|uniref:hypothetical protein n=1 Tax=Pseudoalteromonas piratica TaxID=1348114 RepID=UPI000A649124|nr:hypothetical protein [Pseudoalteromonas piratica]
MPKRTIHTGTDGKVTVASEPLNCEVELKKRGEEAAKKAWTPKDKQPAKQPKQSQKK